jgi:hypothetical protein
LGDLHGRPGRLEGAGRVEDTFNLLGHAGRKRAEGAAHLLGTDVEEVCRQARAPVLLGQSMKATLDIDWIDAEAKQDALNRLVRQVDRVAAWVERHVSQAEESPLRRYIEALGQVKAQDLEPAEGDKVRVRQGVAPDRRVSIEDEEMRHGRKSKSKRFNGYKQHIGTHLDAGLVLACTVTFANRPEEEATPELKQDLQRLGMEPNAVFIDRAYVNSELTEEVKDAGGEVVCKPWSGRHVKPGAVRQERLRHRREGPHHDLPRRSGGALRAWAGGAFRPGSVWRVRAARPMHAGGLRTREERHPGR